MTAGAPLTRAILFLCVGVQLLSTLLGAGFDQALLLRAGLIPARLTGEVVGLDGSVPAVLTLVTHQFLHGGWVHLLMNMLFFVWIGREMEWLLGWRRLLLLFLLSGVAGGLLQVAFSPTSMTPAVGASGSISGVFAAYALLFARTPEAAGSFLGWRISPELVRAFRYAALWSGLQLLTAVAFNVPGGALGMGGIAIWSHIGGFIAGLLFALPLVRRRA